MSMWVTGSRLLRRLRLGLQPAAGEWPPRAQIGRRLGARASSDAPPTSARGPKEKGVLRGGRGRAVAAIEIGEQGRCFVWKRRRPVGSKCTYG
eukprot:5330051-Prymnesium_polylepis.1